MDYRLATLLYYACYLVFPYSLWLIYRILKSKRRLINLGTLILILTVVFIWATFIETQWLRVKTTPIKNTEIDANIVLVSDLHLGAFKGRLFVERLVEKINAQDADFNIFAGDYVYAMNPADLQTALQPLQGLNRPSYFVMGNHDHEIPGIKEALLQVGLIDLEHHSIDFGAFQITGVGDHFDGTDEIVIPLAKKPTIVVAHNPDSSVNFDPQQIDLVLSGHTHCGQVRIPILYKKILPTQYGFDCGLEQAPYKNQKNIPVYISPGVGETAMPFRLLNPPTIDLLHLHP